jgi:diaminopimelate decarboxylase
MSHFDYRNGEMFAEDVAIRKIAKEIGTPAYVYSLEALRQQFRVFDRAFSSVPHLVCFSVKANSNIALLRAFAKEGGGFDIVSAGELFRALKAGADPKKIVFSGVGKTREEIEYALESGILMFNVESEHELLALNEIAGGIRQKAPISLRINPDVDPQTHPYISTGMKKAKFGVDIKRSVEAYKKAASLPNLEVVGVDCHIGSQLTSVTPFVDALARVREYLDRVLVGSLQKEGARIRYLDLGGGLGITYNDEMPPRPEEYARAILEGLAGLLDEQPSHGRSSNGHVVDAQTVEWNLEIVHLVEPDAEGRIVVQSMRHDGGVQVDDKLGVGARDRPQFLDFVPAHAVLADGHAVKIGAPDERTQRRAIRIVTEGFCPEPQHHVAVSGEIDAESQFVASPDAIQGIEREMMVAGVRPVERRDLREV